jgi:hypothetical protein
MAIARGTTHRSKDQFLIEFLSHPLWLVLMSPPEALPSANNIAEAHRSYDNEADDTQYIDVGRVAIPRVFLVDFVR